MNLTFTKKSKILMTTLIKNYCSNHEEKFKRII